MLKRIRSGHVWALVVVLSGLGLIMAGCSSDEDGDNPIAQGDVTAPSAPAGVVASAGATSDKEFHRYVDVSWDANAESDLAGYNIYWSATPDNDASYEYLGYVPSGTESYQDEKAETYTYVYYKVSAVDDAANESDRSDDAIARVAPTGGGIGGKNNVQDPTVPGD